MYGLMLGVISCTGDRTEPSSPEIAVIIDEQPISTDETSSTEETALTDETSSMDEISSTEETILTDETSSMDETAPMNETSSVDEISSTEETILTDETPSMNETSLAAEEESMSSGVLFQELRVLSPFPKRDGVGLKDFIERELPSEATPLLEERREFFSDWEASRLLEEGEIFLSQEEVTAFITEDETVTQPSETGGYLNVGIAHYERGNYLRAIEFLKNAVKREIGDLGRAYHYLGLAYFAQQDYDQAIQNYDEAIERGVIEAYRQRGNAYSLIGNFRQANEDYNAYQRLSE